MSLEIKTILLKACNFNKEFFENLKKEDYNALKLDIKKNGIKTALHITKANMVLCGHQRLKIALELGLGVVPCEIINIDENNDLLVKEYIIKDNILRRHLTTEQKYILIAQLSKLYELGRGGDRISKDPTKRSLKDNVIVKTAKETGVSESTVDRAREYERVIAEKPELKGQTVTIAMKQHKKEKAKEQRSKVVKQKKINSKAITILQGDAVEQLKKLPDNSVDCVVTDPPYGVDYKPTREDFNKLYADESNYAFELLDNTCKELKRVCKENAHVYIFSSFSNAFEFKKIIGKYFEIQDNWLVWVKNNHTMCDFSSRYANKYEIIWFCSNKQRKLNNSVSPDVLNYSIPQGKQHSAQKPVDLLKYLVENSTVEGEVVIDPFAGSGSTGVACKELKRPVILIEKEADFIDIIKERLGD